MTRESESRLVLITELDFRGLESSVHGVFQRFRLLVSAAALVAGEVMIVRVGSGGATASRDDESEAKIREHWGVSVRVVALPLRLPPSRAWIVEQLIGALSFRWSRHFRGLASAANRSELRSIVAPDTLAVIAHKLPCMEFASHEVPGAVPIIFDLDDIEHVALERRADQLRSLRHRAFAYATIPSVRRAEARAIRKARHTLVCSESDKKLLDETLARGDGNVTVLPNTAEIRKRGELVREPVLLFVGALGWHPNSEAIEYFVANCWAGLRALVPGVRLLVAGKDPQSVSFHANPPSGVEFLGFVPDIAGAYAMSRVVICPIRSGGGTRVKLVEAAAFGKPIVSTSLGAEGLGFTHGAEALIADDAAGFVAGCARVLADDALAESLAANVHEFAVRRFSREGARQILVQLMHPPGREPPAAGHK